VTLLGNLPRLIYSATKIYCWLKGIIQLLRGRKAREPLFENPFGAFPMGLFSSD
jgi:hypothetical protein